MSSLPHLFLRAELINGLGAPELVVYVVLLLEGVDGGKVELHLARQFHSAWSPLWPVAEAHIDLAHKQ